MESQNPKRHSYSAKFKLAALRKLRENSNNINKTASMLNISNKMLRDLKSKENRLIQNAPTKNSKSIGSGRTPKYPELERQLKEWIVLERGVHKRLINYDMIRQKIAGISASSNIAYSNSSKWIHGFLKRTRLSVRQITHVGQEDNTSLEVQKEIAQNYLTSLQENTQPLSDDLIFNMDETPVYVDMIGSRTVSFLGEKTTEVVTTGSEKTRLTAVICISKLGILKKTMVILKGLKRVPRITIPDNIHLTVAHGGSMNTALMHIWANNCLIPDEDEATSKLLIMDGYACHKESSVVDYLCTKNFKTLFIPPKTTHYLQPLDVLINAIFKAEMKRKWNDWISNGEKEFTVKGYRKRPSWQMMINWVSEAVEAIDRDEIKKSFTLCGARTITDSFDQSIRLNSKLASILAFSPETHNNLEILHQEETFILNTDVYDLSSD